jgi:hypothetical protein
VAEGIVNRLVPASAFSLGVIRAVVHGTFLISILFTSFSALGHLPVTIFRPTGAMKLLPWSFYEYLLRPNAMEIFKWLLVLVLLFATVGFLTPVTTKLSLLFVVLYQGVLRSFGHFNHDEMLAIYYLAVLAFTPCGDSFSIDSFLIRKRKERPHLAYSYPVLLMWVLMSWTYLSSALIKLRVAGLKYLSPDNLPALAIFHSLDNLHDTQFKFAFWLPQVRNYLPVVVLIVLLWELLFPLVILRRWRPWLLAFGIVFHVSTLFVMNIFFPFQLAMYLIFVDWDKLHARFDKTDSWTPRTVSRESAAV